MRADFAIAGMLAIVSTASIVAAAPGVAISAKDYRAAGNGVTDDTKAIQNAIDAVAAAGGGVVDFPAGTYLLNSNYPSSHPWFFYNLRIGSKITLRGNGGAKLLQGPGGRHSLVAGATEVRNTVLAFGPDYAAIRFQQAGANGGFHRLQATKANESSIALANPSDSAHFVAGDLVAIYAAKTGDVIPTETSQIKSVDASTGTLTLKGPLTRSFKTPSIANVTKLATTDVGVQDLIVQGAEPLAVTETYGFKAQHSQFVVDTTAGDHNVFGVNLNTLNDFQFIDDKFICVGPGFAKFELAQRNSRNGLFDGNTFEGSNIVFGEYAAHITLTNNTFRIHADPSVVAGIAIGGLDVDFRHNDMHCGNVTGGSGWGVVLADFVGPADYASYVGQIRIADNTFTCRADGNACVGVFATDTSVTGNSITATGSARGIHVEGPLLQSCRIQSNKLTMDSGDGMLVVTPASGGGHSVIADNTITGAGEHGIFLNAHGAPNAGGITVSANKITGFKTPVSIR